MRRLLRLALTLALLLGAAFMAVTVLARISPPPPYGGAFTFPDGTPCQRRCLFGARPGFTRYDEAVTLLETHPLTRNLIRRERLSVIGMIFEGREMVVEIQGDARGLLTQISLHIEPTVVQRMRSLSAEMPPLPETPLKGGTLGGTIAWLGAPSTLDLNRTRNILLNYPADGLTVIHQRSRDRLDPSDKLVSIFMYSVPNPNDEFGYDWLGFKPYRAYFDSRRR